MLLEHRQVQLSVNGGCFLGGNDLSIERTKEQAGSSSGGRVGVRGTLLVLFYGHPGAQFAALARE